MTNKLYPLLLLLLVFSACQEESDNDIKTEVDQYIGQLKAGNYTDSRLPEFDIAAIPYLLSYRYDETLITNFPYNPISSFYVVDVKLGIYVLWTIEFIRLQAINSDRLVMRFPSLNPVLGLKNPKVPEMIDQEKAFREAAKAYFNWWEKEQSKSMGEILPTDPLADTPYRWS
ncbi:MAG: DUF4943 family protein [Candidatus Cyclobacteriaceae bacterium M3_2C_046]